MLQVTLAQMRRSAGRLAAAGIAIVIASAFVTATLLAGNAITRTTYDAVSSEYARADLVVGPSGYEQLTDADLAAIGAVPGVDAVQGSGALWAQLTGPGGTAWNQFTPRASDARLEPASLVEGGLPTGPNQIALPADLAHRLDVGVGDEVHTKRTVVSATDGTGTEVSDALTVSGLLDPPSAFLDTGGPAVLDPTVAHQWLADQQGGTPTYEEATVVLGAGADRTQVADAIGALGGRIGPPLTVDERAAQKAAQLTGSTSVLTGVVLGFAAVALLVAALVIANTFQVLVAQRTRMLALLRCVGADRGQLRRGVLVEALVLGLAASATGAALGIGLVQLALTVLGRTTDVPLPSTVDVSVASVVLPLLVGTGVTLLASLAPARAATRVAPLAALAPVTTSVHERSGRVRAVFSVLMVAGGAGALGLGLYVSSRSSMPMGLAIGILGGAVSFIGVLLGSVYWVPALLGRLGPLLGRTPAARLAAANAVRNPRRVATTSGALFIGVTLVAMMATGASSATKAFTDGLAEQMPVDVVVSATSGSDAARSLPTGLADQVRGVADVADVAVLTASSLDLAQPSGTTTTEVLGADPAELRAALLKADMVARLDDSTIVMSRGVAVSNGLAENQTVSVTGPGGTADLTVTIADLPMMVVTQATMSRLDPAAPQADLFVRLTGLDAATTAVADVQDLTDKTDQAIEVTGAAVQRAFFQRVIDTLLAIVVGLLGVAVVIAMVGVTNTLSLSVIERRRESATLRAIGLTRGQLRATLAVEGLLVAGVGTVVGAVLGVAYGWAGAQTLLSELSGATLVVPWGDLGLVLVVALGAGLLASVLPARAAVRTPPVEALATE
ncbi:MAG: ABC transporter permease [Actinomycetales bacterium]|nr:ABC transporter permease [Actinomycetales bacterium]